MSARQETKKDAKRPSKRASDLGKPLWISTGTYLQQSFTDVRSGRKFKTSALWERKSKRPEKEEFKQGFVRKFQ